MKKNNLKEFLCKAALVSCGYGIFSDSVLVPVLSQIYAEFPDADPFLKNFVVTGGYLFSLFAALLTGRLMCHVKKRTCLIFGTASFLAGGVGAVFSPSMEFLAATRILDGISDGVIAVAAMSMITELYSDEKERALLIGLHSGLASACGFFLSFFSGVIGTAFSWRMAFLMNAISVIPFILSVVAVPDTPPDYKPVQAMRPGKGQRLVSGLWKLFTEYFLISTLYCILFVFVDVYISEKGMGTSVLSGSISSLGAIVSSIVGLLFVLIYGLLKRQIPFVSYLGMGIAFCALRFTDSAVLAAAMFAAAACFYGMAYCYYPMALGKKVPAEQTGMYMAKLNASYNIACFVSSYIPYALMAVMRSHMIYESFIPLGVVCVIMAVYLVFRKEDEFKNDYYR